MVSLIYFMRFYNRLNYSIYPFLKGCRAKTDLFLITIILVGTNLDCSFSAQIKEYWDRLLAGLLKTTILYVNRIK